MILNPVAALQRVETVCESISEDPRASILQEFDISRSSLLQIIVTKDLHLYAYPAQLAQQLKPIDAQQTEFVKWIIQRQIDADFSNEIIFRDEAHFHIEGLEKIVAFGIQKIDE